MTKPLDWRASRPLDRKLKSDIRRRQRVAPVPRPRREDQAFLPADLEILETPPSPVRLALILLISAFVVMAVGWSWISRIEIVAVAQGKIQPTGRVKVVQPLEAGKVAALNVENGQQVKAGDVLIEMDRGDAEAEDAAASAALMASKAEIQRRQAAIDAARRSPIAEASPVSWDAAIPMVNREREEHVLLSDLAQLASTTADIDAQIHQKAVERDNLVETIKSQEQLLTTLNERVDMREALVTSPGGSRAIVLDSLQALQTQRIVLTTQRSQLANAIASLDVLAHDRDKVIKVFLADNAQRLAEAQRQVDDLEQRLNKARLRLGRMKLLSPIDGAVLGLAVTTIGQVLTAGEDAMRIVPDDATLEIEGYIANKDIGFIKPGQTAVVKIDSFPFSRYGTINAEVTRIGHDAVSEPEAQQTEANGTQHLKTALFASAPRTQNLVFPVTLKLVQSTINVDGQTVPLRPGMEVKIEIATGSRSILAFFVSPFVEVSSQALRDR